MAGVPSLADVAADKLLAVDVDDRAAVVGQRELEVLHLRRVGHLEPRPQAQVGEVGRARRRPRAAAKPVAVGELGARPVGRRRPRSPGRATRRSR